MGDLDYLENNGKQIDFDFPFQNSGNSALEIMSVKTSCDCTQHTLSKQIIAPGESALLSVGYSPTVGNTNGVFREQVWVKTNCRKVPAIRLEVSGAFPGRISIHPRRLDFGVVEQSKSKFLFIDIPPGSVGAKDVTAIFRDKDLSQQSYRLIESNVEEFNKYHASKGLGFIDLVSRKHLKVYRVNLEYPLKESKYRSSAWIDVYVKGKDAPVAGAQIEFFRQM